MAAETQIVPLWLEQRLTPVNLVTWESEIPRGQPLPAVIISMQGDNTISYVSNKIALLEQVWQVKAVDAATDYGTVADYAQQIQNLLHGSKGDIIGGYAILSCKRQSILRYRDDVDAPHVHLGGLYRIQLYPHA